MNANQNLPAWEPYPGPVPQESTFVAHGHLGAVFKKELIIGAHYIYVFSNDNERAGSYQGGQSRRGTGDRHRQRRCPIRSRRRGCRRTRSRASPSTALDMKLLGGVLGDGYIGYSHLSATNALYLADAIEVLHSFGGWQLHDNYFGAPGGVDQVTGTIDSVELQYSFSFGQLFHYPQAFWGDGPDLIGTVFGMFNHVNAPMNTAFSLNKLKFGTEWTYVPLPWLGLGARYDVVEPNLDQAGESFSVISPRIIFRTAFVTHEQIMIQYSRYFYGALRRGRRADAWVHERVAVPVQQPAGGVQPGRRQERGADRGHHLVLTNLSVYEESTMKNQKSEAKRAFLVLAGGSLMLLGCIIPDKSATAPSVAPGSAASIGGGAAAAPAAAAAPGVAVGKDCGPNALIDDGEDGNNQNLPNDNRGGYWYTFKDKGTTTVEPTAGEEGGTFAMSAGGHDSQYAARYHGTIGTGAIVFSGMGMNFIDPKGRTTPRSTPGSRSGRRRAPNRPGRCG